MFQTLIAKLFGGGCEKSKDVAKERLKVVLVHDRVNLPANYMENIKNDILMAISNYMEVNETQTQINLTKNQSSIFLIANIPVTRVKRGILPMLPLK